MLLWDMKAVDWQTDDTFEPDFWQSFNRNDLKLHFKHRRWTTLCKSLQHGIYITSFEIRSTVHSWLMWRERQPLWREVEDELLSKLADSTHIVWHPVFKMRFRAKLNKQIVHRCPVIKWFGQMSGDWLTDLIIYSVKWQQTVQFQVYLSIMKC